MSKIDLETSDEIARTVAVIINEDILNGTVMQTVDKAILISKAFIGKYPLNTDWAKVREETNLDWDECIIEFTKNVIETHTK